tara:strand:+ start:775 stop:1821 length:1047 start_codon:yes stop_codon:yes gene_type:complete
MAELKSLKKRKSPLAESKRQVSFLAESIPGVDSFVQKIATSQLKHLTPDKLEILQINLGYMCNMTCEHCHVDAGPDRKEIMSKSVLEACLLAIDKSTVNTVDLTGGAPEMNPHFMWFVEELSKRNIRTIVRSNLTILVSNKKYKTFPQFFKENKVVVIASLPCYTEDNTDKQRGKGTFNKSLEALKVLNVLGYGKEDSDLELNLVFNPGGSGLPPEQAALELDYKRELKEKFDIEFNSLFTITNLPISRFLDYLLVLGRYEEYMKKLHDNFNPDTLKSIMCTNTLSVDWEGNLYDCDFNQMLQLKISNSIGNILDFDNDVLLNRKIVLGNHCFGCTAGAGSSCQGSLN